MKPTKYKDINEILSLIKVGLENILSKELVGFYLTGSLTYNGFDSGSSDIDFLVVLTHALSENKLEEVEKLHTDIGEKYSKWCKRIEGSYVTVDMLSSTKTPKQSRPYLNAGKMWDLAYGNEWILDLHMFHKFGVDLIGPDPKELINPVGMDDIKEASKKELLEVWQPKLKNPVIFDSVDYDSSHLQAYAIVTMCRILYTASQNDIASKQAAIKWAKEAYSQWSSLIEEGEIWKHGIELNSESRIINFIKFTIDVVR